MTNITPRPKWERIEAGYYSRAVGLHRRLEIVHLDHTLADKLYENRWVVRLIERRQPTVQLGRFPSKREARAFADEWRSATHVDTSGREQA